MGRAMRRAAIPAWVTEGFNPHLFLTFALPLSLGQEGIDESMDIKLPDDYDLSALPAQLNAVLPEGLVVLSAAEAVQKPAAITWAEYEITLSPEEGEVSRLYEQFSAFFNQPQIMVTKKSKAGDKQIDLRPYYTECTPVQTENAVQLRPMLPAGGNVNINPALLIDAFATQSGLSLRVRIVRQGIYDAQKKIFA